MGRNGKEGGRKGEKMERGTEGDEEEMMGKEDWEEGSKRRVDDWGKKGEEDEEKEEDGKGREEEEEYKIRYNKNSIIVYNIIV